MKKNDIPKFTVFLLCALFFFLKIFFINKDFIFQFFQTGRRNELLDFLLINIVFTGDLWFCLLLCFYIWIIQKKTQNALSYLTHFCFVFVMIQLTKNMISDESFRWYTEGWLPQKYYSQNRTISEIYFPSGYMSIILLHCFHLRKFLDGKKKWFVTSVLLILSGCSIYMLGNANLFNLLFGLALALICLAVLKLLKRLEIKSRFIFNIKLIDIYDISKDEGPVLS